MKTGLFEKRRRQMHIFKRDDIVTIFQMHPTYGLEIEDKAVIRKVVEDVDEQYEVTFINEPGETYERFVDRQGQGNPTKYAQDFNARLDFKPKVRKIA